VPEYDLAAQSTGEEGRNREVESRSCMQSRLPLRSPGSPSCARAASSPSIPEPRRGKPAFAAPATPGDAEKRGVVLPVRRTSCRVRLAGAGHRGLAARGRISYPQT